jgi:hypothetical protein
MGRKMILDCWNQPVLYRRDCFFSPTTYQEVTTLAHDKGLELFTISDIHSGARLTRRDYLWRVECRVLQLNISRFDLPRNQVLRSGTEI